MISRHVSIITIGGRKPPGMATISQSGFAMYLIESHLELAFKMHLGIT